MAADRGLCGGFNANLLKEARRMINELVAQNKQVSVVCVGSKARDSLQRDFRRFIQHTFSGLVGSKGGTRKGRQRTRNKHTRKHSPHRGHTIPHENQRSIPLFIVAFAQNISPFYAKPDHRRRLSKPSSARKISGWSRSSGMANNPRCFNHNPKAGRAVTTAKGMASR